MFYNDCKEHWCEHFGSEKCARCKEKESARDRADLRVILKRRADALMELDKSPNKNQGQERDSAIRASTKSK